MMRARLVVAILIFVSPLAIAAEINPLSSGEKRLNNLVSELLAVSSISKSTKPFTFTRYSSGWIFISSISKGKGTARIILDKDQRRDPVIIHEAEGAREAMSYVAQGEHMIQVECEGNIILEKLIVKAIPELIHCGLGFDPQIKSYGHYDMDFLQAQILPNVTTLIVPSNIKLAESVIDDW